MRLWKVFRILLPLLSLVAGIMLGVQTSVMITYSQNPYFPYEHWHKAHAQLGMGSLASTAISMILFYFHSGGIHLIVVKWPPPILFSCEQKTKGNGKIRRHFIPVFWAGMGHSYASWTFFFFTIEPWLGMIPLSTACVFWGALSTFSRKDCRRLIKIGCGSGTYEVLADIVDVSSKGLQIEGEEITYTLDQRDDYTLRGNDRGEDSDDTSYDSNDTSDSDDQSEDSHSSSPGEMEEDQARAVKNPVTTKRNVAWQA